MIIKNQCLQIPLNLAALNLKNNFVYFDSSGNPFGTYFEDGSTLYLPSESLPKLKKLGYSFEVSDLTPNIDYKIPFNGTLRYEQEDAVNAFFSKGYLESGILQAKCGFGKSYALLALLAKAGKTALIVVHTKLLFYQWEQLIKSVTGIERVGLIGDGKFDIQPITVALYQTAINKIQHLQDKFTIMVVDECHRCPANLFSTILMTINSRYKIGTSATLRRQDGRHVIFQDHFGELRIKAKDSRVLLKPSVEIILTDIPYAIINPTKDRAKALTTLFSKPELFNVVNYKLIKKVSNGRCPVVQAERVQFLRNLQAYDSNRALLIGEVSKEGREEILQNIGEKYNSILTTTIFDEGVSCHRLDTLFVTTPSKNFSNLEQRIGRIEREHEDKQPPLIVDFWYVGKYVQNLQLHKLLWYQSNGFKIEKNIL